MTIPQALQNLMCNIITVGCEIHVTWTNKDDNKLVIKDL